MAKRPVAGEVKTRLVPPLSHSQAAGLYRCLLLDLLSSLRSFAGADLFVSYTPVGARDYFVRVAPANCICFPQGKGDLGERMHAVFFEVGARGYTKVVLMGSDFLVPPGKRIERAFHLLTEHDAVLGPTRDGGYCLIGMRHGIAEVFQGVEWGTGAVLRQTRAKLAALGLRAGLLPSWSDIDTPRDLARLNRRVSGLDPALQPRTLQWLKEWRTPQSGEDRQPG